MDTVEKLMRRKRKLTAKRERHKMTQIHSCNRFPVNSIQNTNTIKTFTMDKVKSDHKDIEVL